MRCFNAFNALLLACIVLMAGGSAFAASLPDGRTVTPIGFTIPVEGFASSEALSPDGKVLAVLSQDGGAIDVIVLGEDSRIIDRLSVPFATGMAWTTDGLFVTRGYTGAISRFTYTVSDKAAVFTPKPELQVGGLLNGIAEDPATHRIIVARTAAKQVAIIDDTTGDITARLATTGQPFSVAFAGNGALATLYDSDHIDVWTSMSTTPSQIATGPHPTALLLHDGNAYVANADGHDISVIDTRSWRATQRFELGLSGAQLPGQTPSGMAISNDGARLFVAESGFNDIAVLDTRSARVVGRIPTAWYPMGVVFVGGSTIDKDPRHQAQLYVVSAKGSGPQPDPGSEWDGISTGLVEHLVIEPQRFAQWTATVARNNRFQAPSEKPAAPPPIKHFVFIVKENKHFDEVFGDVPRADADPALLLYGRKYTPNAHALAESYTLFDNFMGDGDRSDFGHSWTTQAMANDYLERNVHTLDDGASSSDPRVAGSIWPVPLTGEDKLPIAALNFDWFADLLDLPGQPRVNVSGVFGPNGELIDALHRHGVSFRVYGEQMTMRPDGSIASGLNSHAARPYPGAHIDFDFPDTERAKVFLADVAAHGLAQYSYLTLPTDHTAGTKAGFYTPASYVGSNDAALGQIIAGLSRRPEWKNTVVFVTEDDPQGTGDHVDARRMPAFMIGPFIRRGYIDHTRYSFPAVLRTVEVLFGVPPLNIYDAAAPPILDAFASQPSVSAYRALPSNVPMTKNPGKAKTAAFRLDGPDALAIIPQQEWASIKGGRSLADHLDYLRELGKGTALAVDTDDP
ncbi:MAG: bifunctional YncE family protein/alkaline phosphatase family protein [Candidatus Eremiobacteraeota bacterium]|nr:bifunctional YncE family protein/alkaline phosphatase family protein [Candidatus Eremiobacteraeota bacterium]